MSAGTLTAIAVYALVAALCRAALIRAWGRVEAAGATDVALLWPLVPILLPVYYLAAIVYTVVVVVRGRRVGASDRAPARPAPQR